MKNGIFIQKSAVFYPKMKRVISIPKRVICFPKGVRSSGSGTGNFERHDPGAGPVPVK